MVYHTLRHIVLVLSHIVYPSPISHFQQARDASVTSSMGASGLQIWESLSSPLTLVPDPKTRQPVPLLSQYNLSSHPAKHPPPDAPSALLWIAAQIANPPSLYVALPTSDGRFFDKVPTSTHCPSDSQRYDSARWIFGNSEGEYKNGARAAFFRETLAQTFITFCQLIKLRQPRTLTAVMNLILSISLVCSGLPQPEADPDQIVSTLLASLSFPESLRKGKHKLNSTASVLENPLFGSLSVSSKLGLMRGRAMTLETLHIARCVNRGDAVCDINITYLYLFIFV